MSVSPNDTDVVPLTDNKRCFSKLKRFGLIKLIGKCVLLVTVTGLVISNTVIIHNNSDSEKIIMLDEELGDLKTSYDVLMEELKDMKSQLAKASIDFNSHKIANDESFMAVNYTLDAVDHDLMEIELDLNETKVAVEWQQDFTTRELELVKVELGTIMYNASCDEIQAFGVRKNGYYHVQPSLDVMPFVVYCEFRGNKAVSILEHTQSQSGWTATPYEDDGCDERGCFVDEITYQATQYQIESLIYISQQCEQEITHTCSTNSLTGFAFWHDRNGNEIAYWHGDKHVNDTGCACFEDNSCEKLIDYEQDRECNCDDQRANLVDYGILSSRSQLPVMQLNYGGSKRPISFITYELGPLKCSGHNNVWPSEIKSTSFEFMIATDNGNKPIIQKNNPLKLNHTVYDNTLGSIVDGTFFAPVDGLYRFELQMSVTGLLGFYWKLDIRVNDISVTTAVENGGASLSPEGSSKPYPANVRHVFELALNVGDDLVLMVDDMLYPYANEGRCLTGAIEHDCTFLTGRLLRRFTDNFDDKFDQIHV